MATNIKTVMTYPLDGSTTDFNIPFEYLARKFVRVTLIGVDRKELILNQDYRFATKTTISTTRALGPADGYNMIEIRRFTSATDRLVDFTDGSILRAYDLNISQVQTLHVAEEARDLTADTIGVNNDGNLDARGRRIVNLADGVDDGDAISLGQVKRWNESAWNSKVASESFADWSKKWAVGVGVIDGGLHSARQYGEWTASIQADVKNMQNDVSSNTAKAQQAATTAVQAQSSASSSAANALSDADLARRWANAGKDVVVANGEFSAYHYMVYASIQKTEAAASAASAKADADRAQSANPDNQLKKNNNLSDLPDKRAARNNIGLDWLQTDAAGNSLVKSPDQTKSLAVTNDGKVFMWDNVASGIIPFKVEFGGTGGQTPWQAATNLQTFRKKTARFGPGDDTTNMYWSNSYGFIAGQIDHGLIGSWIDVTSHDGAGRMQLVGYYTKNGGGHGFAYRIYDPNAQTWKVAALAYGTNNTTVDPNGFIKVASPIVKLFTDSYETNEEAAGVTVSHIGVGKYKIDGCLGLNSDPQWGGAEGGFELPRDINGQVLIWLDYEVNPDGSILVSTYHRTYPESPEFARNIIEGFSEGSPIDIPAGKFLSVRVGVPEGTTQIKEE